MKRKNSKYFLRATYKVKYIKDQVRSKDGRVIIFTESKFESMLKRLKSFYLKAFPIAGGAQAKVEDVSRVLLNTVSQIPGKTFFQQVTSGSSQPFADIGKKIAVSYIDAIVFYCS